MGTARGQGHHRRRTSVHPHVRGDGFTPKSRNQSGGGSPPRAWGRRHWGARGKHHHRFTPTCVGTAGHSSLSAPTPPVHPHVRGDGDCDLHAGVHVAGSPPRAWGRRIGSAMRLTHWRFTPTCVGTAHGGKPIMAGSSVHPHVRGDGAGSGAPPPPNIGSPPRAWGRRCCIVVSSLPFRFTPTCVGTAEGAQNELRRNTVHPHVRGDGIIGARCGRRRRGSPPRAWGRRPGDLPDRYRKRFTPTCVGTARRSCARAAGMAVHPHVRGDGSSFLHDGDALAGSPPRAWGRRPSLSLSVFVVRFTPTCVGTARLQRGRDGLSPVHPHVRGDGVKPGSIPLHPDGSPPRAWGRRGRVRRAAHRLRFTPTCVGTAPPRGVS